VLSSSATGPRACRRHSLIDVIMVLLGGTNNKDYFHSIPKNARKPVGTVPRLE
jgi:hypothetical protein